MFKKTTHRTHKPQVNSMPLLFDLKKTYVKSPIQIAKPSLKQVLRTSNDSNSEFMSWGKPIWIFLHSLASNIKNDYFVINRKEILRIVYSVCTNLPCHICSEHAKHYLDSINFNNIQTCDKLITELYLFHNVVNKRKNYILFQQNDLVKYNSVNMKNIINDFIKAYNVNNKLNIYSLSRQQSFQFIKKWLHQNYQHIM